MTLAPLVSTTTLIAFGVVWVALVVMTALRSKGRANRIWATVRRAILGLVLFGALLGPAVPVEREDLATNVEIFLAVDRTGSMAAEDIEGSPRLDLVSQNILTLLEATPGARYSIITWDGSARRELPLTTDTSAVASFAELLHQEISEFSAGSSLNRPYQALSEDLQSSAELRPGNTRYLIVISDGESTDETDTQVSPEWEQIAPLIDGGAVFGYGTEQGGPMKIYRAGEGPTDQYIEDPANPGQNAISSLDQNSLQELADLIDVPLLINPSEADVVEVGDQIMANAESQNVTVRNNTSLNYVVWPFGVAAAIVLGWELASFAHQSAVWRRRHAI